MKHYVDFMPFEYWFKWLRDDVSKKYRDNFVKQGKDLNYYKEYPYNIKGFINSINWERTNEDPSYWVDTYREAELFIRPVQVEFSHSFYENVLTYDNCIKSKVVATILENLCDPEYITGQEINYVTLRKGCILSFLPKGKELLLNDNGEWRREGRQEGRMSKSIRKIFTEKGLSLLCDKDFEIFSNLCKSIDNEGEYKFELVSGEAIRETYCMDRVQKGILGDSCMNGDGNYLDIYVHNDIVSILRAIDGNGKLIGRALVWKISDTITFMDRIYSAYDWIKEPFLEYAHKEGWWRKEYYDTYEYKIEWINPEGDCEYMEVNLELNTDFDLFPYIDTFTNGCDGYLNNYSSDIYHYINTGGERTDDSRVYDEVDDCYIDYDDSVSLHDGTRTHELNAVWVSSVDEYYLKDECTKYEGDWYPGEEMVETECGDLIPEEYARTAEDGCVYHERELVMIHNGEYHHVDDCVNIDGEWYLERDENVEFINGEYKLKEYEQG